MSSSACDHFKISHGYNADMFADGWLLSQRQCHQFLFAGKPASDFRILPDPAVYGILQQDDLIFRQMHPPVGHGNVNAAVLLSQMKADGRSPQFFPESACQHMFTAVLLHMIQAAFPVNPAVNGGSRFNGRFRLMPHNSFPVYLRICNPDPVERSGIKRLSS